MCGCDSTDNLLCHNSYVSSASESLPSHAESLNWFLPYHNFGLCLTDVISFVGYVGTNAAACNKYLCPQQINAQHATLHNCQCWGVTSDM